MSCGTRRSCRVAHDTFFILEKYVMKLVVWHTTKFSFGKICHETCRVAHDKIFIWINMSWNLSCGTRQTCRVPHDNIFLTNVCRVAHDTVVCILVETLLIGTYFNFEVSLWKFLDTQQFWNYIPNKAFFLLSWSQI